MPSTGAYNIHIIHTTKRAQIKFEKVTNKMFKLHEYIFT